RSGDGRAAAVSGEQDSDESNQSGRREHREVSAVAEQRQHDGRQRQPELRGSKHAEQSWTAGEREGRSPFQSERGAERRLPLSVHRRTGDQLLSGGAVRAGRSEQTGPFTSRY